MIPEEIGGPRADPANWGLRCKWCERMFTADTTMGEVRAHVRGAHQFDEPELVLEWIGTGPRPVPARMNGH